MFSVVSQSPETTRERLEPPRIVCRLSVVRPSGSGDPVSLFLGSKEPRFRGQLSVVCQSFCRRPKAPKWILWHLRLAFEPWNYGMSSKTCNSELKGDRFPIVGKVSVRFKTQATLDKAELPCLILPLGETGEGPEEWLEWTGPIVRPRATLDAQTKHGPARSWISSSSTPAVISSTCAASRVAPLQQARSHAPGDAGQRAAAKTFVEALREATRPFAAACARACVRLHSTDSAASTRWCELSDEFITRQDPAVFGAERPRKPNTLENAQPVRLYCRG